MNIGVENARRSRIPSGLEGPASVVVTGDERHAGYWRHHLGLHYAGEHLVLAEKGLKGNFLGSLQAYSHLRATDPVLLSRMQQIVMLVGAGTRLSPFTQALGNMKSAFPLPDGHLFDRGFSVGEAAMGATQLWIGALSEGGFRGMVIRWGDEVQIPSVPINSRGGEFAECDAVRFGWSTPPNELLATQKEWFIADSSGRVLRDIPRQPLDSLMHEISAAGGGSDVSSYVNLGSLAASHRLLEAASKVFERELEDPSAVANWDPFFWIALQTPGEREWQHVRDGEFGSGGVAALERSIPDFFSKVRRVKELVESESGKEIRVGVLDFGRPYWLDAGSHIALSQMMRDIFAPTEAGQMIRAFLALPDELAEGGSVVRGSKVAKGARVANSIILGSEITDGTSDISGAVIVNSRFGRLRATSGSAAMYCRGSNVSLEGPSGFAFRVSGDFTVAGDESLASLLRGPSSATRLRYSNSLGPLSPALYSSPVCGNSESFADASLVMERVDPVLLDRQWDDVLGR